MVIVRELDDVLLVLANESGRQYQEIGTNGIQGGRPIFGGQAEPFEPMNEIGCQQQDLEERHIGRPGVGGNFPQRVIVKQFSDVLLDRSSGAVEQIHPPGADLQVGDEHMVKIVSVFEQAQLPGLFGTFGNGATDHHKSVQLFPLVVDPSPELPNFPALAQFLESDASGTGLDVGILLGHDHVAASCPVEKPNDPTAIKTRIQPESDTASANPLGDFPQADGKERDGSSRRDGIAGPQRSMPEFLEMGLEAEQGMVGTSSGFLGIVAHPGLLLFAIDHDHHRIDIEDQGAPRGWQRKQISSQAVVEPNQLPNGFRRQSLQKAAQSGWVGEALDPQHFQKSSVVLEDLGLVDTSQSHDDGKHKRQEEFGGMIVLVPLSQPKIVLQAFFETNPFAKTLNQPHPTEVGDMGFVEGEANFLSALWHNAQSTPLGAFLRATFF